MKKFNVEYMNQGQKKVVTFTAQTKAGAVELARQRNIGKIVKTSEVQTKFDFNAYVSNFKPSKMFAPKLKLPDLIASIAQLSVMAGAGISIHDSVREVANSTQNKRLKEIFTKCYEDLNSGLSLSLSLEVYRKELGDIVLAMIKLGESTGNLGDSLKKLASMLQELYDNNLKFKKAMRYPQVVVTAIAIAFTILMLYVVPKFKEIFEQLGANLPLATRALLFIESALRNYGLYMLLALVVIIIGGKKMYVNNRHFKDQVDKYVLKIYLIGKVVRYASMSRFNLIFTELVRSGIPIADALDTSLRTITNTTMKARLNATKIAISRGMSLTEAFKETNLYENMLIQMIKAGEASGQLDAMLEKVTDYYKERFNTIIDNMSSYIEPILMLFIAAMVLFLALGIFLPMWDLGSAARA
ncbi:type II secretion system F family protein [Campylobacter canadensis]|uniref:Type II secretion system F family protein n=1 Tax=Campylobacter canadensis TaxID=449520 RepID=A0ABS7WSP7_9BACT|nr:type II secretion system F family protein [Campylobacter canadensis]MBZ7987322.1 type II secretion system F family protein [Campylobacter canadensis]MBZ7994795.1 type II secretion system F family protein [Campylobacter canadensis]MBZ7996497.1 type II secretion system F family protein [Campylobacter canadensis]MBZ7998506.1 type II secretion system F family protein [Campylobacter canadensis]MBZ8000222.1 type II secretion system F family protein [Campylobacter canadensis]